ncbi:hypothetical protein Q3G72_024261 [Acer saccharum]|nr:hypothetical protein Q3G72_024261 [Acer saccharum]
MDEEQQHGDQTRMSDDDELVKGESTERACREKCMEDLVSTTRYVSWSLHNKNRAGLRQFLDSFGGIKQSAVISNPISMGVSQESSLGSVANEKQDIQQIFHGIREYFLASAKLKFNCFLLMPVVDKLRALLREDLESVFEDDMDNVFDLTNLRHSLSQHKQDTEIELKRIKRLREI